jgi:hypothetical protein
MHICNQIVYDLEFICWVIAEISSFSVSFIPCEQIQVLFFHSFVNYHEIYNFQLLRFLGIMTAEIFHPFLCSFHYVAFFPISLCLHFSY